jgi:hypothetical protein
MRRNTLLGVSKISEISKKRLEIKPPVVFNPVRQALEEASRELVLEALESPNIWEECTKNAYRAMFEKNSPFSIHRRSFSTSSRLETDSLKDGVLGIVSKNLKWQPKSIADIHPPEELKDAFEKAKGSRWEEVAETTAGRELTDPELDQFFEDLRQFARDVYKDRKICRFNKLDDILEMLKDGLDSRFKSQCETRKCGNNDKLDQEYVENVIKIYEALYGYPRTLSYKYHPIHAIATPDMYGGRKDKETDPYGNVAIFFKPLPKGCATTMAGDSPLQVHFDHESEPSLLMAMPAPFEEPNENIWPLWLIEENPTNPGRYEPKDWNPLDYKNKPDELPTQYEEVQIHPLLMEDQSLTLKYVGRMVIREPLKENPEKVVKLIRELKKIGISWDVGKNEEESKRLRQEIPWLHEDFLNTKKSLEEIKSYKEIMYKDRDYVPDS